MQPWICWMIIIYLFSADNAVPSVCTETALERKNSHLEKGQNWIRIIISNIPS